MTTDAFIASQLKDRQDLLTNVHGVIVSGDTTVTATVGTMMGKQMILYTADGVFKYGLAPVKNYISLHVMPIYGSPALYAKFKALLPAASFQKGCINFTNEEAMPLPVVRQLIAACSKIDLKAMKEMYLQSKKG